MLHILLVSFISLISRNADKDEKPALEIGLQDLQFVVCDKETWRSHSFKVTLPTQETYYFAAETYQQLVTWLNVLVKERDRLKFATVTKVCLLIVAIPTAVFFKIFCYAVFYVQSFTGQCAIALL